MATKAALEFTFDDEEVQFQEEAAKGPTPVPTCWYTVGLTDVAVDLYKTGTTYAGKKFLTLTIKVLAGEYKGRQVRFVRIPLFERWNPTAKNPNGTATSFFSFFDALGLISDGKPRKLLLKDFNQLFGKELDARIIVGKPRDDGSVWNEVQPFGGSWRPRSEAEEGSDEDGITFEEETFSL